VGVPDRVEEFLGLIFVEEEAHLIRVRFLVSTTPLSGTQLILMMW